MGSKTSMFFIGLVVTGAIMVLFLLVFIRPDTPEQSQDAETIFSTQEVNEIKSETGNLQNFGNLPNTLTPDDVGRENPFDPYK